MASIKAHFLVGFGIDALKTAGVVAGILAGVGIALNWPLVWTVPLILVSVATSGFYIAIEEEEKR